MPHMPIRGSDALGKERCDCGECFEHEPGILAARCHPGRPVWAVHKDGIVLLLCSECEKPCLALNLAKEDIILWDCPAWVKEIMENGITPPEKEKE